MNFLGSWPVVESTGQAVLFGCTAVFMIACALGVLFLKKAAYAAICMVGVMIGLAVLYLSLEAPFLGVTQVVVYTGAIMMLFLFVIMMIGIGATDGYTVQGRGKIYGAILAGLGLALVLVSTIGHTTITNAPGYAKVDPYSDQPITDLATTLFSEHWLTMELAGALLITAAIGAMLLTHSDRLGVAINQHETVKAKMRAFAQTGRHIGQLPAPGVYARTNAADVPAISGETLGPVEESVPRVIRVRGLDRTLDQVDREVAQSLMLARAQETIDSPFALEASAAVARSGSWGMPGPAAPTGLDQPEAHVDSQPDAQVLPDASATASIQEEEK
ncbi:NADH-quinone oxidoreductase subunit J [Schaalia sp. ZJ405]|uniref:NADH-quinone oxidoreductase subunit J n=1 Tax=Schaalia sp. ZJ405 TaxID=2709403 RepID=UPI0013EA9550|nr:NADH-quinone oxidoreductase subunit J [Schaalia sp. ZJ405]QPK81586.1 NADH-quinone oxidoreductase subunit J [Schaalia sp. ZJ405]